jgi:hypothetical protein
VGGEYGATTGRPRRCGWFDGVDGRQYPAIATYAHLGEDSKMLGNPCGYVGNGGIHEAMVQAEIHAVDLDLLIKTHENIYKRLENQRSLMLEQCDVKKRYNDAIRDLVMEKNYAEVGRIQQSLGEYNSIIARYDGVGWSTNVSGLKSRLAELTADETALRQELANVSYARMEVSDIETYITMIPHRIGPYRQSDITNWRDVQVGNVNDIKSSKQKIETFIEENQRTYENLENTVSVVENPEGYLYSLQMESAKIQRQLDAAKSRALNAVQSRLNQDLASLSAKLDVDIRERNVEMECELAEVSFKSQLKDTLLTLAENALSILKSDYTLRLGITEIKKRFDQADRLFTEMEDNEQLLINLEAAKNSPNARIYRNSSMLGAERTFWNALREAYKATKLFEYYTSQSYDGLQDLYLVRTISAGEQSLEAYLDELNSRYISFEELHGNPDVRVLRSGPKINS